MNKIIDLTDQRFDRLLVLEFAYVNCRHAMWKCQCDCGNIKVVCSCHLRSGKIKSCGCLNSELKKARCGDKNPIYGKRGKDAPNWNLDLTDKDRIDRRYIPEYKEWRKSVYGRDDYICQMCEKRGGILNAHHIYPWALFESLRFETWNGVALCGKCHRWVHSKKNVDKNYLEEV